MNRFVLVELRYSSPVHETQGQERGDAIDGDHEDDADDLALLPRLHEVGQVEDDLQPTPHKRRYRQGHKKKSGNQRTHSKQENNKTRKTVKEVRRRPATSYVIFTLGRDM